MMKIAFLFLTISGLYHEVYWQDFLAGNPEYYSLYIHAKKSVPASSFFKAHELSVSVSTQWEHTMRAQILLLREALKDPDNYKFLFLSESDIPLQDFMTVYSTVTKTDKSIFPYCVNPHQDPIRVGTFWGHFNYQPERILKPIPAHLQYKNPTWVILNRNHAQLLVDDTKYIDIISKYPCDSEHYPSTVLAIYDLLSEVENTQTTYDNWTLENDPARPYMFTDLADQKQLKTVLRALYGTLATHSPRYLFARKFARNCDLSPLDAYLSYRKSASITPVSLYYKVALSRDTIISRIFNHFKKLINLFYQCFT